MRKLILLIALLTIVLAGCRVESNVILEIEEDGSALVGAEIGYDEEFGALLEDSGASPDELFSDLPAFGDDVVAIERTDGDMTYVGAASSVDDISNFQENATELGNFSSFSYEFDDDGAALNATVSAEDIGELGGEGIGELGIDPSQLTDEFFSANVVVTMPGEVTEHNADVVRSDGTLVWKVPFTGSTQISAVSTFGSSAPNWTLIILIGLLLIGVIAVVAAIIMSRRQSQSAVDQAAASHTAATLNAAEGDTPPSADATLVDESVAVADGDTDEGTTEAKQQDAEVAPDTDASDAVEEGDTDDSGESSDDQPENT